MKRWHRGRCAAIDRSPPALPHGRERGVSEELTPQQEIALRAVLEGEPYANAALRAKVTRETVSRWAHHHPLWRSERQRRTEALEEEYRNQKLRLIPMALGALEWLLRGPDYIGEHYDPRVQLDAVRLALSINGFEAGRGPIVQVNNLLAAQQTNTGNSSAGGAPTAEPDAAIDVTPAPIREDV